MKKRILSFFVSVCLLTALAGAAQISAESAILLDADTGKVFYEKDADERRLIASTTKIMTALCALSSLDPDAQVRVPEEAARIGGSSMYLKAGEVVSVRALVHGLLLLSGNDAAYTLAEAMGGQEACCARMNALAARLGLADTHFANPHGLDDPENYSSARDLALLASFALKNPDFAAVCGKAEACVDGRRMRNHNKLLSLYPDTIGVKTGFTKAAGRCLVSAVRRSGRTLVCVSLSDPDDWNDHIALYDEAFSSLSEVLIANKGECALRIPLADGEGTVRAVFAQDITLGRFAGEADGRWELALPRFYYRSPEKGAVLGTAYYKIGAQVLAQTVLVCG